MAERFVVTRLADVEPITVAGGLHWRPLRRSLGVQAFGINAYVANAPGDDVVESHTEETLGHEELYVVVTGHATFVLDDQTIDAPSGTLVYIADPATRRHAVAREAGTTVVAIGGKPGSAYSPSPWESTFAVERFRDTEQYAAGAAELEAALDLHPGNAEILYQLGCWQALAGRADDAIANVRAAIERDERYRELARTDSDLDTVRELLTPDP